MTVRGETSWPGAIQRLGQAGIGRRRMLGQEIDLRRVAGPQQVVAEAGAAGQGMADDAGLDEGAEAVAPAAAACPPSRPAPGAASPC
ncbi:hypothetical protein BKE38_11635 [Pseudoroseomonas deserti]|uniref:Uncharacterized protein n=1 Tax=Teichococcus deserti TaxID=1817963 RepID=A0A1V2H2L3_9PROT|nr:hypothetical protein BKE38_11635 [Pseudoroseomonas deserti]